MKTMHQIRGQMIYKRAENVIDIVQVLYSRDSRVGRHRGNGVDLVPTVAIANS